MTDVTFDTETTGLDMWYPGGGLDGEPARPFLFQWATDENPDGEHSSYKARGQWMKIVDQLAGHRWVAHNLSFDVHQLGGVGIDLLDGRKIADTDHLARLAWPDRRWPDDGALDRATHGYKLKDLAKDYVDPHAKDGEEELVRLAKTHGFELKGKNAPPAAYYELWKLEPEAMEFYAREDVRLTLGLLRKGESLLTEGTARIWALEQELAPIVIGAERKGICVDREKLAPLRAQYKQDAEEAWVALDAELETGWDQNNDVLAEALQKHGVPLTETTESGQLAVNQKVLGQLEAAHPIITQLFEWRTKNKFVTTYLDHMDHDVIHQSIWQLGTWTGRMAASNPNLQNVPVHAGTAVRELYVPRPGYCFVGLDFEQIELRLLAYYLHDTVIQDRVANEDFFAWVAAETDGQSFGPEYYHKGEPGAAWRQTCKNATYAIAYGVGGLKLGRMLGWPPDSAYTATDWVVQRGYKRAGDPRCLRAEALIKQIKAVLTGYGRIGYRGPGSGSGLLGRIGDKVAETGAVDTILGRHQWLGYDGAWKGLSGLIQGGAADIFKLACIAATEAVAPYGAYPLLFIHDEIDFEAPVEHAERVLEVAGAAMKGVYDLTPALEVEGGIGYHNWAEVK